MKRFLKYVYWLAGAACIGYYFVLGFSARFGLSQSWIWPLGGAVLILAGGACLIRLPGWLRAVWRTLLCVGLALMAVLVGMVVSDMNRTPPEGLDYLIVLGARVEQDGPSRALQHRIDAAAEYMMGNKDTIAIASGGKGADEPVSEAACIRDGLIAAGIAPERILLEDQSSTTAENMRFSEMLIPDEDAAVGIVTNNFHVHRALGLARKAGIRNPHGIAAEYTGFTLFHYMVREALGLVADAALSSL